MQQFPDLSKIRRLISRYSKQLRIASLGLSLTLLALLVYFFRSPLISILNKAIKGPSTLISFSKNPSQTLQSTNDRTNLLLLGMGGPGHEGANLTDSMVVMSFYHPTKKVTLISLPRDVWVEPMRAKINTAYYYGELKQPNSGGLIYAKDWTYEVTGLPIHYVFALDFEGFKKAIDLVGGIDINVENGFDDYFYPIPGKENAEPESDRYEHLHFDAGLQHMEGYTALKFVRSRKAEGDEGTDFARSARQQKVMVAFKDKLLNQQTLLNPQRLNDLFSLYQQYIHTDITSNDYAAFARLAISVDTKNIKTIPLTTGDKKLNQLGVLENPPTAKYDGQWVLIARDNNWDALKQYIQNELNK